MTSRSSFPEGGTLRKASRGGTLRGGVHLGMLRPKRGGHTYFAGTLIPSVSVSWFMRFETLESSLYLHPAINKAVSNNKWLIFTL